MNGHNLLKSKKSKYLCKNKQTNVARQHTDTLGSFLLFVHLCESSCSLLSLRSAGRTSLDFSVCRTTVHQYKIFLLFLFSPKFTYFQRIYLKMDLFYMELYSKLLVFLHGSGNQFLSVSHFKDPGFHS